MTNSQQVKEWEFAVKPDSQVEKPPLPVAVIETNPKLTKTASTASGILINATSQAIVVPTNVDVYITSAQMKWIKDAASTSVSASIAYTDELGTSKYFLRAAFLTLTAEEGSVNITFPHPIKIKYNAGINITSSTNVPNISIAAVISYFTDEVT